MYHIGNIKNISNIRPTYNILGPILYIAIGIGGYVKFCIKHFGFYHGCHNAYPIMYITYG